MGVTKPYKFVWLGDLHGPKPNEFIGFRWAFISQTLVRTRMLAGRFRDSCFATITLASNEEEAIEARW